MKIHFIISKLSGGGAERVLVVMANSLSNNPNNDISIITLFESNIDYELDSKVKVINLKRIKNFPSHTLRSIINLSRYYWSKKNKPDVIISFITLTNLITIIVAKIFSIKIIAQEHNSHHRYMKGRKLYTDFTKKFLYSKADIVTVLTSYDVEFYKNYKVNVRTLPNPCSFSAIMDNTHTREKVILAVGNLDRYHHKGFDNLIELIYPILNKYPDWVLKIAGSGEKGLKYLESLGKRHNISKKIVFTGFVSDVSELMNKSSIFVLSSRFEGLPMVLLEAMSQGMACIAYDCITGPSDIISHNVNGLLIENQNHTDMQKGIIDLIENNHMREKLGSEGIKSLEKYHIDAITDQYEKLINELTIR